MHNHANLRRATDLENEMSFGSSPSDIIILVKFCKEMYRKCRDAAGEYDEISREVRGVSYNVSKPILGPARVPRSTTRY